ncbi:Hypothetical predicted protein [Olea europaea subsp. europaea]|uniref:Uncharacterized protein n=1 Tax=Olea europaea subsp. europaea TaxID=158383 RepID=A0A8S0UH36_OLEEU|nr:Hypothetical predicted protein [Olea europaea subsp. europaea]
MPDLDLVEALPDNDVAMFEALYFITAYLFPRDYEKVVNYFQTERSIDRAGTSEKSVPSVLLLIASIIGQAHSFDNDNGFVAPPPRRQEPSIPEKSLAVEGPLAVHHSQEEPQSHRVENVESIANKKGKGKMDTSDDLPFSLEPPSFDFGIEYTPPDVLHSEEIQKRVDSIIFDMVMATKTIENEVFTVPVVVGHISHISPNNVIFIGHRYTHF